MIIQINRQHIDELAGLRVLQQKDDWQEEYPGTDEELFAKTKQFLEQHLNRDLTVFAELRENALIATCGIQILQVMPQCCDDGQYGYVCNVYTKPEYRHRGIQKHLFEKLMEFVTQNNVQRVYLSCDNPVAIRLYKKFGFKRDDWSYKWMQK